MKKIIKKIIVMFILISILSSQLIGSPFSNYISINSKAETPQTGWVRTGTPDNDLIVQGSYSTPIYITFIDSSGTAYAAYVDPINKSKLVVKRFNNYNWEVVFEHIETCIEIDSPKIVVENNCIYFGYNCIYTIDDQIRRPVLQIGRFNNGYLSFYPAYNGTTTYSTDHQQFDFSYGQGSFELTVLNGIVYINPSSILLTFNGFTWVFPFTFSFQMTDYLGRPYDEYYYYLPCYNLVNNGNSLIFQTSSDYYNNGTVYQYSQTFSGSIAAFPSDSCLKIITSNNSIYASTVRYTYDAQHYTFFIVTLKKLVNGSWQDYYEFQGSNNGILYYAMFYNDDMYFLSNMGYGYGIGYGSNARLIKFDGENTTEIGGEIFTNARNINIWFKNGVPYIMFNDGTNGGKLVVARYNAPVSVSLTAPNKTEKSVDLAWTSDVGVSGYNIYNGATKINTSPITTTNYSVTGLTDNTDYGFTIKAVNEFGEILGITTLDVTTKTLPVNFNNHKITDNIITNIPLGSTVSSFINGLTVRDDTKLVFSNKNTILSESNLVTTGTIIDVFINDIKTYTHTIVIYGDLTGEGNIDLNDIVKMRNHLLGTRIIESEFELAGDLYCEGNITLNSLVGMMAYVSESGTIIQNPSTTVLVAPTGIISTSKTSTTVSLSWRPVGGCSGYNIYEGSTKVNSNPILITSYTVTGLTNNTAYNFTIKSINSIGPSLASKILNISTNPLSSNKAITDIDFTNALWSGDTIISTSSYAFYMLPYVSPLATAKLYNAHTGLELPKLSEGATVILNNSVQMLKIVVTAEDGTTAEYYFFVVYIY